MSNSRRLSSVPTPSQVERVRTADGSRREISRTVNRYVLYPRLRVSLTSEQIQSTPLFVIRRWSAPLSSVQAFAGSNELCEPPRKLAALRAVQSYPLKCSVLTGGGLGAGPWPLMTVAAATPASTAGSSSVVRGGRYPGLTSNAAYSLPRCVWFFHLELPWITVNGFAVNGWIHHSPSLQAYKTICWPGLPPVTWPSIVSNLSGPPRSVAGTLSNTTSGVELTGWRPQLTKKKQSTSSDVLVHSAAV